MQLAGPCRRNKAMLKAFQGTSIREFAAIGVVNLGDSDAPLKRRRIQATCDRLYAFGKAFGRCAIFQRRSDQLPAENIAFASWRADDLRCECRDGGANTFGAD